MTTFIVKYSIYFIRTKSYQKGEIAIEDGVIFRDNEGMSTIVIDEEDARNYVKTVYKKDLTKLIKITQEVWDDDESIDFTSKDTKLVIDSVSVKKK